MSESLVPELEEPLPSDDDYDAYNDLFYVRDPNSDEISSEIANVSTWIIMEEIVHAWSGIPSLTQTTKTLQQISNAAGAFLLSISGDGVLPLSGYAEIPLMEFHYIMNSMKCISMAYAKCTNNKYWLHLCYFGGIGNVLEEKSISFFH